MTDESTTARDEQPDHEDQDLHDWMRRATDTLVIDPTTIGANAVRSGHRRRRVRGLAAGGLAASVVVLAAVSVQVLGDRVGDRDGGSDGPGTVQYVDRPGGDDRSAIGNVTIRPGARGLFTAKGGLAPRSTDGSRIELWAGRRGEALARRTDYAPRPGFGVFGHRFRLAPGTWDIELRYVFGDGTLETGVYSATIVLREESVGAGGEP